MKEVIPPSPDAKKPWFEPVTVLLMAFASLGTAWCSYQSSNWNNESSSYSASSTDKQRQVMALHLEATQIESSQVSAFLEIINATLKGDEKTVRFYTDRIQGEFKAAYEKWIALKPFENPKAPPHPFIPGLYESHYRQDMAILHEEADQNASRSTIAGNHANGYLSLTVILATVLFFAGTAGKFDHRYVRFSSLIFALTLFLYCGTRMLMLPVKLGG